MRLIRVVCCGATVLLSACGAGTPHALCVDMENVVTEANGIVQERAGAFRNAMSNAAAISPAAVGAASADCPVTDPSFDRDKVLTLGNLGIALPTSLQQLASADAEVALFRDTCGRGDLVSQQAVIQKYRAAIAALPMQNDLLLIERERVDPTMQSATTFTAGSLSVTGLVYSHADQRVVCQAEASVSNRELVSADRALRDTDYLQLDLNQQAMNAVRGSLHAIATP